MCHIIVFGSLVSYAAAIVHTLSRDSRLACSLPSALVGVAFALMLGPLFDKTYRIHLIFNNTELKVKVISTWELLPRLGALLLCELVVQVRVSCVVLPPLCRASAASVRLRSALAGVALLLNLRQRLEPPCFLSGLRSLFGSCCCCSRCLPQVIWNVIDAPTPTLIADTYHDNVRRVECPLVLCVLRLVSGRCAVLLCCLL